MKFLIFLLLIVTNTSYAKDFVYITSDTTIPFWQIMSKGITDYISVNGDTINILNSNNSNKQELINVVTSIKNNVDGVILSPCTSKSAKTSLGLFEKAGIPVVIADVGSDSDNYVSYISSDNYSGSHVLADYLIHIMFKKDIKDKTIGIIAIPQKRANGKARTDGFMASLKEHSIKTSNLYQQVDFSLLETYNYAKKLIDNDENIGAIWLQGSDKYKGALRAIKESGRSILLLTFDAEPSFLTLIKNGDIVASAMQQPYVIGKKAIETLYTYLDGGIVEKEIKINTLVVTNDNIEKDLDFIKKNVFGIQ